MKRILSLILCIFVLFACSACENVDNGGTDKEVETDGSEVIEEVVEPIEVEEPKKVLLPFENSLEFGLATGAGGWYTSLILDNAGSIYGAFHDNEYGETGERYENGTQYWNEYWGFFSDIKKINDYSYKMMLKDVATSQPTDVESIDEEEKLRFLTTDKITGIVDDTEYILYLPNTEVLDLPSEIVNYLPTIDTDKDIIDCYILYSVKEEMAFVCEF